MALSVNAAEQHRKPLRGRFIQTQIKNSIAIQNMRVQGFYRAAKDDNGSKKMVNLKNPWKGAWEGAMVGGHCRGSW